MPTPRMGSQSTNDASAAPLEASADQDPYDSMLLTKRQTSVVTDGGGTQMLDTSPSFYGSQQDEQDLFNTIGADGGARRRAGMARQDDNLADALPAVAPVGTPASPAGAAAALAKAGLAAKAQSHWKMILGIGAGAAAVGGLLWFLRKRRHARR